MTKPEENGPVLEIVSRDQDGGVARTSRRIRVTNKAPELTVTPRGPFELEPGQNQPFSARTRDPEGTQVTVSLPVRQKQAAQS